MILPFLSRLLLPLSSSVLGRLTRPLLEPSTSTTRALQSLVPAGTLLQGLRTSRLLVEYIERPHHHLSHWVVRLVMLYGDSLGRLRSRRKWNAHHRALDRAHAGSIVQLTPMHST
jgi:hypothetical protein